MLPIEELDAIQEELQSTWDRLVRHRHALQDRAKGRPTNAPAWTGVRHTTSACNRLQDAITHLAIAQRALLDGDQRLKEDNR
jgi:hypothetical protein